MDNTANSILNFFLDKSRSFGVKTALTISLVGLLFLIDFGLNLSYNFSVNNKISQLERIHKLKSIYQNDSLNFYYVNTLENQIISKKHYSEFLRLDLSDSEKLPKITEIKIPDNTTTTAKLKEDKSFIISTFWMVLSSNYSLVLLMPFVVFLPLFPNQKYKTNYFFGWIALNVLWAALIALVTVIAFQIPIIDNNPVYNYWLNGGIHSLFLILIILIAKKK